MTSPLCCADCRRCEPAVLFCWARGGHVEMSEAEGCAEFEPREAFDEGMTEAAAHFSSEEEAKGAHGK